MNKFLLLLLLPLISFGIAGCSDEDDVEIIDVNLLAGQWEVVSQTPERNCIYDITAAPDLTEGTYGGHYGKITTYYLTATGKPLFDKEYNWSIRYMENHQPLLDLTLEGELDNDDPWEGNYYYKIIKLTDSLMWWQSNSNGDNTIIKFRRRTDLKINQENNSTI